MTKYKGVRIVEFEGEKRCAFCDFFNINDDDIGFCTLLNCKEILCNADLFPLLPCPDWCELEKIT